MKLAVILKLVDRNVSSSVSVSTEKGIEINKGQKKGLFLLSNSNLPEEDVYQLIESLTRCEADNRGSATNLCNWKERLESGQQVRGRFALPSVGIGKLYYAAGWMPGDSGQKALRVDIKMTPQGGSDEIPDLLRLCPYCGDPMDPHMGEERGRTWSWAHPENDGCIWSGFEGITNRQISAVKNV